MPLPRGATQLHELYLHKTVSGAGSSVTVLPLALLTSVAVLCFDARDTSLCEDVECERGFEWVLTRAGSA